MRQRTHTRKGVSLTPPRFCAALCVSELAETSVERGSCQMARDPASASAGAPTISPTPVRRSRDPPWPPCRPDDHATPSMLRDFP